MSQTVLIIGSAGSGLADRRFGALRVVAGAIEETGFELFDSFDGQVAAAGGLLFRAGSTLRLHGPGVDPCRQAGAWPGFVTEMPPGPVQAALAGMVSPLRRITSIGPGRLVRRDLDWRDARGRTVLRARLRRLHTTPGRTITLIELHPSRGHAPVLARVLADLEGQSGARAHGDAAALAKRCLFPDSPACAPRPRASITQGTTAHRAACEILRAHLALARRSEPGILADLDTECLHDYRVALRKLRSVISLFRGVFAPAATADLKSRFGAVMAHSGRLRDLDVCLLDREAHLAMLPAALRPGLELLFEAFAAARAAERAALVAYLESPAYRHEIADLAARFDASEKRPAKGPEADRPAIDLGRRLIRKRYRKTRLMARKVDETTPDARLHRLRIQCKKLRYLMEIFAPLFEGQRTGRLIKPLKRLQDRLGVLNDHAVQQASLGRLRKELSRRSDPRAARMATSLGALLRALHKRGEKDRRRLQKRLARFDGAATRAGFRQLCAAPPKAA